MIYFLRLANGAIKIGCTSKLRQRMSELAGHYQGNVALLKTIEGTRTTEREIHERFAHLRMGRTEQFQPASDLLEFIGADSGQFSPPSGPNPLAKKYVRVSFNLPEDLVEDLATLRRARNVNLSRFVEGTLREALRRLDRRRATTST